MSKIMEVPRERARTPACAWWLSGNAASKAAGRIRAPVATNMNELNVCAIMLLNSNSIICVPATVKVNPSICLVRM